MHGGGGLERVRLSSSPAKLDQTPKKLNHRLTDLKLLPKLRKIVRQACSDKCILCTGVSGARIYDYRLLRQAIGINLCLSPESSCRLQITMPLCLGRLRYSIVKARSVLRVAKVHVVLAQAAGKGLRKRFMEKAI